LAIDLAMSDGAKTFAEPTTHPFSNVVGMRGSSVHKWMALYADAFGFFPFKQEPWHWEFNPPGFASKYRAAVHQPKP
jgi:hypothetical protein